MATLKTLRDRSFETTNPEGFINAANTALYRSLIGILSANT